MSIKFNNVFYTYSPKTPFQYEALKGINLSIKKGSFTCIVGHTGCGKSTLIQHINGLLLPTSGNVQVNDFVLAKDEKKHLKKIHDLRKEVGVVFQFSENQLFDETVESDVAFGPTNFGIKKEDALETAHAALKMVGIPESYYKKSPFELSGGEKRRVAIAGVLAIKPSILILDEPTAGLDPRGAKEILDLFKVMNGNGITVILVTHDINLVYEYGTDVIVMENGKVVIETTPSELFKIDTEKYSLETPLVQKVANMCLERGLNINLENVKDIEGLVKEIVRLKK